MDRRRMLGLSVYAVVTAAAGACSAGKEQEVTPGLQPRGTTMTTVKPSRQDVTNKVSLTGKVELSPIYGIAAPVTGQVRYLNPAIPQGTPTKPTKVANVVVSGKNHAVEVPAGSVFQGRLLDDRSNVTTGMPIVSAKYVGYGIVATIDGAQAYKVSDSLSSIQAQIQGGPGPFACTVVGTVAALPEGTVPAQQQQQPAPGQSGFQQPFNPGAVGGDNNGGSTATGLRMVCIPPAGLRMINGATATIELVTASATNALVLPVEAVAGAQGKGKVDVLKADGTRETREVELGLTDGRFIEIKSGLNGDENIAVPAPNLPEPKNNPQNGDPRFPGGFK